MLFCPLRQRHVMTVIVFLTPPQTDFESFLVLGRLEGVLGGSLGVLGGAKGSLRNPWGVLGEPRESLGRP